MRTLTLQFLGGALIGLVMVFGMSVAASGFAPIQITHNSTDDRLPDISGSNVVWEGWDGNDGEIYFWDGSFPITTTQITNNNMSDGHVRISGSNVVWSGWDGNDLEIFYLPELGITLSLAAGIGMLLILHWHRRGMPRTPSFRAVSIATVLLALAASGCAPRIARLAPVDPYIERTIPLNASVSVPTTSLEQEYIAAGTRVLIGAAFAQYAEAYARRGFSGGPEVRIEAELIEVNAANFQMRLAASIRVSHEGGEVFKELYTGESSGSAWDGMYSDRNLYWGQAANEALRVVFNAFLEDARAHHRSW